MSNPSTTKKTLHSNSAPELAKFLNLKEHPTGNGHDHNSHSVEAHPKTAAGPDNLPVIDSHIVEPIAHGHSHLSDAAGSHVSEPGPESLEEVMAHKAPWQKALKAALPYLAVFVFGLAIYYFFLSKTDFSTVLDKIKPAPKVVLNQKESALQTLEKNNLAAYNAWIAQYYFDVSDASIVDPNVDNSGNGLSNFQKFLLNLNPRAYDTLGIGMPDSQALSSGINPATGSPLNDKQKEIVDKYFDMEAIMNRLALSNLHNPQNVAGASVGNNQQNYNAGNTSGNNNNNNNYNNNAQNPNNQQSQNSGSVNALGNQQNNNNSNTQNNYVSPKTGANLMDISDIDQTKPGLLEIPSLKLTAPVIWTQNPKSFDTDLQSGVVHYPGTAMPGQVGTTYISGHSSNYSWAKGSYNRVFSKLGDLADNASFTITVYTKQGKTIKYHYVVTHRAEFKATDQSQFQNSGTPTVALSTCWPVNTTQKRLVVFGEQTQVEQ